jgi:hypothetical protein
LQVPLIGEGGKPSPEEEFLRIYPKKSIEELMNTCDMGMIGGILPANAIRVWYLILVLIFTVHVIRMCSK